jgi:tetratricopeptide (TPR) repeat protein
LISSDAKLTVPLAVPVAVDVFTPDESRAVLREWVTGLTEQEAGQLAEALDHWPLAITQAGAFLAETGMAPARYRQLLDQRAGELLARGRLGRYPVSLAASWQLAFDRLAADHPAALQLLCLAAHMAPEPIPITLFTAHPDRLPAQLMAAAGDPLMFADLLGVLRRRALARIQTDSLQLHRLVQALLRTHLTSTGSNSDQNTQATVLGLLRAAVPAEPWNNPDTWPAWRTLLPHVLATTGTRANLDPASREYLFWLLANGEDLAWLLDRAATYLQTRGEPRPSRPLFDHALQLRQQLLGQDHPDTLISANNLALVLTALGEYTTARQLGEDILVRFRRVLGDDHHLTLISANNLAGVLRKLGERERAHQLGKDTLARFRGVLGEDHPQTLTSAGDLAVTLRELGEHEQARQLGEDILARSRRVLGEDHPRTLTSASRLAVSLYALRRYEQARQLDEDTLARRRGVLGEDHLDTLNSAANLASVLSALGKHVTARQLGEDTLARFRRVLGEDHPFTLTTAHNLALDLVALGEHTAARRLNEWIRAQQGS